MGIVVPALRLLFVLLNVYETFKTLKLPPPSPRNGGQPTVRAMSQRKRAMKGCMSIWLIWFCFALYERTADRIVGIFIPFYSEIKSIIILFFLLTRAKGAEPVYLHILRPLVRPYTDTLDSLLDFAAQLGDVMFVFLALPFHLLSSLWNRWATRKQSKLEDPPVIPPYPEEEPPVIPPHPDDWVEESEYGTSRMRKRPLQSAHDRAMSGSVPVAVPSRMASHEIWTPPPAYEDSPPHEPKGLPTPPAEDQFQVARDREWRQYEPFPAAYPLSPEHATIGLPAEPPSLMATLGGIYQQPTSNGSSQGFQRPLKPSRESYPDSDDGLSDGHNNVVGVDTDDEMSVDGDYEDDDEEDDFDVTLRTPARLSRAQNVSNLTSTSMESRSNASTGLTTVDDDDPFRPQRYELSDTASVLGQKRPPPRLGADIPIRPPLKAKISDNGTIRAKPTARGRVRAELFTRTGSQADESSASGTENREDGSSTAYVRKRTLSPKKGPIRGAPARGSTLVLKPRKVIPSVRPVTKTTGPRPAPDQGAAKTATRKQPVVARVRTGGAAHAAGTVSANNSASEAAN